MTTAPATPFRLVDVHDEGREFVAETPVGKFDLWVFGPKRIWFVSQHGTNAPVAWHGASKDEGLAAIAQIVAQKQGH